MSGDALVKRKLKNNTNPTMLKIAGPLPNPDEHREPTFHPSRQGSAKSLRGLFHGVAKPQLQAKSKTAGARSLGPSSKAGRAQLQSLRFSASAPLGHWQERKEILNAD